MKDRKAFKGCLETLLQFLLMLLGAQKLHGDALKMHSVQQFLSGIKMNRCIDFSFNKSQDL